jgi:hypothetical protein
VPSVRKLTPEEVQALENKGKGQRKLAEEQYDAILGEYAPEDYGEAVLEPGENRLTVRNRLRAAAKRRGLSIDFRRTKGDLLRFQVVAGETAQPPASANISTAKRPGRKKKGV